MNLPPSDLGSADGRGPAVTSRAPWPERLLRLGTGLTPGTITAVYLLTAALWIAVSDRVVSVLAPSIEVEHQIQTLKGWLFVALSGWGLFTLMRWARAAERRERHFGDVALAGVGEPVYVQDDLGRFRFVNAAAEGLFGRSAADLLGKTPSEALSPAVATVLDEWRAGALAGTELLRGEATVPFGPDGADVRTLRLSVAAAPLGRSGRRGVVGVLRDATALRRDAEALQAREAAVRQAEKLESLGRMAGGIAHDVNNVLTIISTAADLAVNEIAPGHAAHPFLSEVRRATQRAADLMRRLLTFTRHRSGSEAPTDVETAVGEILDLLARMVPTEVRLVHRGDGAAGMVALEPGAFTQVVLNLVMNAAEALPDGGVVDVRTERRQVGAGGAEGVTLAPGDYTVLRVADPGIGMTPETLARAMDPFFTTKAGGTTSGTGLGLAMVEAVVRQAGGQLRIESAPGRGTTATVFLPRLGARPVAGATRTVGLGDGLAAPARRLGAPEGATNGQGPTAVGEGAVARNGAGGAAPAVLRSAEILPPLRPRADGEPVGGGAGMGADEGRPIVLLVEDEEMVRELGRHLLGMGGFEAVTARDGADALRVLAARPGRGPGRPPIDALVTDVVMPRVNGAELAARLQQDWPALPVLFVSAYAADDRQLAGIALVGEGARAFLQKPFTGDQLVDAVRGLLAPRAPGGR